MSLGWVLALALGAVFVLGAQAVWIIASAIRSLRARTLRSLDRLRRELQGFLAELRLVEDPKEQAFAEDLHALIARLECGGEGLRGALCEVTEMGFLAGQDTVPREVSRWGSRGALEIPHWGWVELAVWDLLERLSEEERLWRLWGSRWVGTLLGLAPLVSAGGSVSVGALSAKMLGARRQSL